MPISHRIELGHRQPKTGTVKSVSTGTRGKAVLPISKVNAVWTGGLGYTGRARLVLRAIKPDSISRGARRAALAACTAPRPSSVSFDPSAVPPQPSTHIELGGGPPSFPQVGISAGRHSRPS